MPFPIPYACMLALFSLTARALDGIVVPDSISPDQQFQVSFLKGDSDQSDQFRVFLAAASVGQNGPLCYLQNTTTLTSPFTLTIPAAIGPSGTDYSIGIADITTLQGATYSNKFNFTGGIGQPTDYEHHLDGAPFWTADDLPCSAMSCARQCAQASYPNDLSDDSSYDTMKACILKCPGVTPDMSATKPAQASSDAATLSAAVVTLASSVVLTAYESIVTSNSTTFTEAIIASRTLTLGSAAQTVSSASIALGSNGLNIGGSTTLSFSKVASATSAASATSSGGAATSSTGAAAIAHGIGMVLAGAAGLIAFAL